MDIQELLERLKHPEDNLTERKLEGAKDADLRKTIVAFANSVPDGQAAVLYVGVSDDTRIKGVANADSLQKTIREICERDCYPPIMSVSCCVLPVNGKQVLAVIVQPSNNRPHFAGPAYVRRGSESIVASKEIFEELIASRLEKPRTILKWRGQIITVETVGKKLGNTKALEQAYRASYACRVEQCTAHNVTLMDLATNERLDEPLAYVELSWDTEKNKLKLIVERK